MKIKEFNIDEVIFEAMTVNKKGIISKKVEGGYVYMKRFDKHYIVNEYTFDLKNVKMWEVKKETIKLLVN